MLFDAPLRGRLSAALATCFALAAAVVPAHAGPAPALVRPQFLLPYASGEKVIDYRLTINAAGTRIVFERTPFDGARYTAAIDLYIADLAAPAPRRLLVQNGSTRPDWCWSGDRPFADGPIAFSSGAGVSTLPPVAGSTPTLLPGSKGWIYPYWFADCRTLAVYASNALANGAGTTGPETLAVEAATGRVLKSLSGPSLWAGFPSVNRRFPGLLAFAGQQFSDGYDQDKNYVYLSDFRAEPPATRPLDPRASTQAFEARYQGRAPVWSPDGRTVAFESNRTCDRSFEDYAVFVQDGLGRRPAVQVTDCADNVQHPKWYRHPVDGRILLVASALIHPPAVARPSALQAARGIASLDVTEAVKP